MRKAILYTSLAAALALPAAGAALRLHERRATGQHLAEGISLLDAPLEAAPTLDAVDYARAQTAFDLARLGDSESPAGRRARALWHVAQAYGDATRGDFSLAQEQVDTAEQLHPHDPHTLLARAVVAERKGDRPSAERALDALAALNASERTRPPAAVLARAAVLRTNILLDTGRVNDALAVAEALDQAHPRVASVSNLLGLCRAAVGDRAGAREAFLRAAALDPREPSPLINLARLQREGGDPATARATLERALGASPDSPEAWLAYGIVLADLHAPEARHALVRAGELAPDDASPFVAQGNLDLEENNLTGAVESYRAALSRDADNATARTNLGVALAREGEREAATEAFEQATRRAPHSGEAWNGLGVMRLQAQDYEHAVGPLQQAAALLPRDPNPALNLGLALEALQRWNDAGRAFREALRRSPGNPVAMEHLLAITPERFRPHERERVARLAAR